MNDPQPVPQAAPATVSPMLTPAPTVDKPIEQAATTGMTSTARSKKRTSTMYDKVLESIAHGATMLGALALWWIGAQFTLAFATMIGIPIETLGLAQWLIPACITAIEIKYWPRKGLNRNLLLMFLIIAGIDLVTSIIGGKDWLTGRMISSYRIPDSNWLWFIATIGAIFSAFWPEKLVRAATIELRKIWNI